MWKVGIYPSKGRGLGSTTRTRNRVLVKIAKESRFVCLFRRPCYSTVIILALPMPIRWYSKACKSVRNGPNAISKGPLGANMRTRFSTPKGCQESERLTASPYNPQTLNYTHKKFVPTLLPGFEPQIFYPSKYCVIQTQERAEKG